MTSADHPTARMRAGLLLCLCALPTAPVDGDPLPARPRTALLAIGFATAVLSQVLCLSTLPLAGAQWAPQPGLAALPLAALAAGSVAATLPAALLRDAFGRRAAFALGSGLGIAGGLLAAWAVAHGAFAALSMGAFWLGIAQGFGFFYRHEGVAGDGRASAMILAAGALAGVAAPTLARAGEALAGPYLFAGSLLVASACHVLALGAHAMAPPSAPPAPREAGPAATPKAPFAAATAAAGLAWLAMGHLMATVPVGLAGCGLPFAGVATAVAWHVVAMYAPAVAVPSLSARFGAALPALAGLVVLAVAIGLSAGQAPGAPRLELALVGAGLGWCLVTTSTTAWLAQSRIAGPLIALHDGLLFACALVGMLA